MGLSTKILGGLIVGVVAGLVLGADGLAFANTWIAPLGTIFMNLIKMMIVPLVFSSLVIGVCGLGDMTKMGRIGGKTFALYMGTTFVAIAIGIFFGIVFQPGVGLDMSTEGLKVAAKQAPSIGKVLMDIFPSNPLVSMTKANMLQIIVFSLALGAGIVAAGEKAKAVADFFEGFAEACYKIIGGIMDLAPIGVFGLITPVIAKNGPAVLMPLIKIIVAVYLACLVHAILVYGGLLTINGLNAVMLHKRNMLMCCRMAYKVGVILFENVVYSCFIANRADEHLEVKVGMGALELHLNIVGIILVDIENNKLLGVQVSCLTAQLAADAAAAAGDQNRLVPHIACNLIHIHLDAVTAQQVLNADLSHLFQLDLAIGNVAQTGQRLGDPSGILTDPKDLSALFIGAGGNCKNDLADIILLHHLSNGIPSAHNGNSVQLQALLLNTIINDADNAIVGLGAVHQLPQDGCAGCTGTDQHGSVLRPRVGKLMDGGAHQTVREPLQQLCRSLATL